MNDPDLVLLDEPTDGVDPKGRRDIREICQQLKDEGRTVFINSHLLSELELVCDRVAIMVQGLVAQQGTIDELEDWQLGSAESLTQGRITRSAEAEASGGSWRGRGAAGAHKGGG